VGADTIERVFIARSSTTKGRLCPTANLDSRVRTNDSISLLGQGLVGNGILGHHVLAKRRLSLSSFKGKLSSGGGEVDRKINLSRGTRFLNSKIAVDYSSKILQVHHVLLGFVLSNIHARVLISGFDGTTQVCTSTHLSSLKVFLHRVLQVNMPFTEFGSSSSLSIGGGSWVHVSHTEGEKSPRSSTSTGKLSKPLVNLNSILAEFSFRLGPLRRVSKSKNGETSEGTKRCTVNTEVVVGLL
jgi:hypothetical protein